MFLVRAAIVALVFVLPASGATLRTLADKTFTGELISVSPQEVVLKTEEGKLTVPVKQVLFLTLGTSEETTGKYADVELVDGTVLHCTSYEIKKTEVKLTLVGGREVQVKLSWLAGILNNAHELVTRNTWKERVLKKKGARDIIAISRNSIVNALDGTFGEASADGKTIEFAPTGSDQVANVPLERLFGLLFSRAPDPNAPPVVCRLTDKHQNRIFASKVAGTPTGFQVETPIGLKLDYPNDQVAMLDYSTGKVVFLSEMKFESKELANLGMTPGGAFDAPKSNVRMQLGGRPFNRGLAVRSPWQLVFDLNGEYREFKSVIGIDDTIRKGDGAVLLRIFGDGKELYQWEVGIGDTERVREVRLNIKAVQKLRIIVTRGKSDNPFHLKFDYGKHLSFAEARITK